VSEPGHESTSSLDAQHIDQADATDRTPVVFIRGFWLLPSSRNRWASAFEAAGHVPVTPGWPDDPATVEEARAHPRPHRRLSTWFDVSYRRNHQSTPDRWFHVKPLVEVVETRGIEPLTPALQRRCSAN
jgi:hypothetical protein